LLVMFAQSPQAEPFRVINGGSGQAMRVSEVASLLAGHWGKVSVRFSGNVRGGDPFSLLADNATLRATGFAWHIPPARGIADYVRWFRERAHG
jgi:UDP-glucose 4-epimerase